MITAVSDEAFGRKMLEVAEGFVGEDRAHDPEQIAAFLAVFGLQGPDVPFCAAGVSYAGLKAYAFLTGRTADTAAHLRLLLPAVRRQFFRASPSCGVIQAGAVARGTWRGQGTGDRLQGTGNRLQEIGDRGQGLPKPGWLVMFNWQGGQAPEHVEIVRTAADTMMTTVGFNTRPQNAGAGDQADGGAIAVRVRSYRQAVGFVATW